MLEFKKVVTKDDIKTTAELAYKIWNQHFISILSQEQIDYMVDKFQSVDAITNQIENENYHYYQFILDNDSEPIGYFSICEKPDNTLFLSKIYIKKEHRGNGYARLAFEFIKKIGKDNGNSMIWLTVNKFNTKSIDVYEKMGMNIIRSEISDIGQGFVMDDYIFGYNL